MRTPVLSPACELPSDVVLAIHGGAGAIPPGACDAPQVLEFLSALSSALEAGFLALQERGSPLDAVEAAIVVLEDCPLFNAGRGAVFTHDGQHELDASLMDGRDRGAGAVAGVQTVKNPIRLARVVLERSDHVLLAGRGAEAFAAEQGLSLVEPTYFSTPLRWEQLQEALAHDKMMLDAVDVPESRGAGRRFGTVGAVARGPGGHLAAGTSTGGMTNKKFGRVGDSPIVGAGVFADDQTCAVSSTGHGEVFIRGVAAYDVAALIEYAGLSVGEAAETVVHGRLKQLGGAGGMIALDARGTLAMPFNTVGMYRGYVCADGTRWAGIWEDGDR